MKSLAVISPDALAALAGSLRDGALRSTDRISEYETLCGRAQADAVMADIVALRNAGFTSAQLGKLVEGMALAKQTCTSPGELIDLVMTGPTQDNIPVGDTPTAIRELIEGAESELIFVGYAVHNGKKVFDGLQRVMVERPNLRVRFFLNIARPMHDTSVTSEIISRFEQEFRKKHWPWELRPEVHYYAPALDLSDSSRPSLHAKCVIADKKTALITSANFTEAAMERNLEAGVTVRHAPTVNRLCTYLDTLLAHGHFVRCPTL